MNEIDVDEQGDWLVGHSLTVDLQRVPRLVRETFTAEASRHGMPISEVFREALLEKARQVLSQPEPDNVIAGPWCETPPASGA